MNITILTAGTRGDVQPYIALALGLQRAGYAVTVASGTNFAAFVQQYGLEYAPLRADYYELIDSPEGKDLLSGNPLRMLRNMRAVVFPLMRRMLDDSWAAAHGAEAIIFHPKVLSGVHLAEKLRIPCFAAVAVPVVVPTRAFPMPGITTRNLGGPLNRATYAATGMLSGMFRGMVNTWRREVLSLPPRKEGEYRQNGQPIPVLHCYSPHLVPIPADWGPHVTATGFWFLERQNAWQPSADLAAFLAAGPPPVYVGFGSMAGNNPERLSRVVIAALQQAGQRGVIATGWGGMAARDLPETICALEGAPHDWLFPRMAAVVHHGGAGTTAAGLRAGKPTVICPFIADQPFWGKIVFERGVGPQSLPQKKLTVEKLAAAIRTATTDAALRQRAEALGAQLRAEDGVGNAVRWIGQRLGNATGS